MRQIQRLIQSRGSLFIAAVVLYLVSFLFAFPGARTVLGIASILCLLVGFIPASTTSKILTLLFLTLGFVISFTEHRHVMNYILSFGSMLNLLSLFSVVPILAIPVKIGGYQSSVQRLLTKRPMSPRMLYFSISGLSYLLACLMNIAAIPMMYHTVHKLIADYRFQNAERFLIQSIVTGYAMPLTWSPVAAVVAAVVSVTKVNWFTVMPITFALSLLGLALSLFIIKPPRAIKEISVTQETQGSPERAGLTDDARSVSQAKDPNGARSVWQIPIAIVVFVTMMLTVQTLTHWSMIVVISILSIPFALAWSLLVKETRSFVKDLRQHQASVQKLQNTFTVFTAAGFFVKVLSQSHYIVSVNRLFVTASHDIGPSVFIILIPLLTVALSLIGFHPVVSIALLGSSLQPSVLDMSPIWLSVALFGGGVLTFIVSPFNATLNVTAAVSGQLPGTIMRWNLKFCVLFLLLIIAIATLGESLFPHA